VRAAIPAFVLLFIGVVTAIPFRRPSPSLKDSLPAGGPAAPFEPAQVSPSMSGGYPNTGFSEPQLHPLPSPPAHAQSLDMAAVRPSTEELPRAPVNPAYLAPTAQRYDEVTVPLQQFPASVPSVAPANPTTMLGPSPSGAWRQGLAVAEVPQSHGGNPLVPAREVLPPTFIANGSRPAVTQEIPFDLQRSSAMPPLIASSEGKDRISASPTSATANLAKPAETSGDQGVARVRHFIREPNPPKASAAR
jgi:hypothetical protein